MQGIFVSIFNPNLKHQNFFIETIIVDSSDSDYKNTGPNELEANVDSLTCRQSMVSNNQIIFVVIKFAARVSMNQLCELLSGKQVDTP